eukprot:6475220-Amphidinium_carterae.1
MHLMGKQRICKAHDSSIATGLFFNFESFFFSAAGPCALQYVTSWDQFGSIGFLQNLKFYH